MEMMISVVLLGLIITFLTSTLGDLRQSKKILQELSSQKGHVSRLLTLLQEDITSASTLEIRPTQDHTLLLLKTTSSLYQIDHPYVRWFVDPRSKKLIRSESSHDLTPPYRDDQLFLVHLDEAAQQCDWMKAYRSEDNATLLIGLKCDKKDYYLESMAP